MVESFQMTHRAFIKNLIASLIQLEKDIKGWDRLQSINKKLSAAF